MRRPPFLLPHRRRPSTDGERGLGILALLLAVVLVSTLGSVVSDDASRVLDEGESLPLQTHLYNGTPHEVTVPGATLTMRIGEPVEEVARDQVDLGDDIDWSVTGPVKAEAGARLVPVSWTARQSGYVTNEQEDPEPIEITLVADDGEIELPRGSIDGTIAATPTIARVLAVDLDVEHSDLSVEVTYDGATQVLDPATGEVDPGAAEGVGESTTPLRTGCEDGSAPCHLTARGEWRPSDGASVTADALRLSAYDEDLGWAGPGRRWASAAIRVRSTLGVENATGEFRPVDRLGRITASLDGEPAESTSGLGSAEPSDSRRGRAVFAVDAASPPKELVLEQELTLEGDVSPRTVTTRKEIHLDADQ